MVSKSRLKDKYKKLINKESSLLMQEFTEKGGALKRTEKKRKTVLKQLRGIHKKVQSKSDKRKGYN